MRLWEFLDGRLGGVKFRADPRLVGARHVELRRGRLYVSPAVESLFYSEDDRVVGQMLRVLEVRFVEG